LLMKPFSRTDLLRRVAALVNEQTI
jgi:hypothetical protein